MKRRPRERIVALAFGLVCASSSPVRAAPTGSGEPQTLFEDALALMDQGRHAEACPKLERSQALDPGMGTQFQLAKCYASTGRVVRAWRLFREVADAAKQAGNKKREAVASQHAAALEPRLARITVQIAPELARAPGIAVTLDGAALAPAEWSARSPIEPGAHVVIVTAAGKLPFSQKVDAVEGAEATIVVPALEAEPASRAPEVKAAPARENRGSGQRIAAIVVGGVGLSGLVVGGVFGALAKSDWDEALRHCKGGDPKRCDATGVDLGGRASTSATVSTIGFAAGGVGLAAATILWLTAPPRANPASAGWSVEPIAGPGALGGVVRGRF